ncbi:hypothetical protein ACX8Z9_08820 [Arthrobacter halodurans]|uniref:Uncharacterized protein n=1 Tax=Arthrobacter halodurans TaxID=516699 RepID=A0ABV4ULA1_9MICC
MEDRTSVAAVAAAYHRYHLLAFSDVRAERLASDGLLWSADRIAEVLWHEPDLEVVLDLLDALVHHSDDAGFLGFVGAGPLEDALGRRADAAEAFDARCAADPVWRQAAASVWVREDVWLGLPALLAGIVTNIDREDGGIPGTRPPAGLQVPRKPRRRRGKPRWEDRAAGQPEHEEPGPWAPDL